MTRKAAVRQCGRGYFAIGIEHTKNAINVGTLWRTADLLGAAFMFTVGRRYTHQASDTMKSWRSIPLFNFATLEELRAGLPLACRLVGVELAPEARALSDYTHHERACYLLGAEDHGLSRAAVAACHDLVQLPGRFSMNVAVAGSIVAYDRVSKVGVRAGVVAA